MEIDRKKLAAAINMPDEQFAALIYAVITAAGGSKMQAMAAMANASKLKSKLQSTNDAELDEMTKRLDPKLLNSIMNALKDQGK